jgi:hypothetical protein
LLSLTLFLALFFAAGFLALGAALGLLAFLVLVFLVAACERDDRREFYRSKSRLFLSKKTCQSQQSLTFFVDDFFFATLGFASFFAYRNR